MPKRGYMRYLFIFLTLSAFLNATQEETKNFIDYQNYYSKRRGDDDFVNMNFYRNRLELYEDGHVWIPIVFHHSESCPCLKNTR
jgi:hypothetical protein